MKLEFGELPIKRQLMVITMATAGVVLLLACAELFIFDYLSCRKKLVGDLELVAGMVEANTGAALLFGDNSTVKETLDAFKAQPHLISAHVFSREGTLVARYLRADAQFASTAPSPEPPGYRFENDRLILHTHLRYGTEKIGDVCVISDLEELNGRIARYAGLLAAIVAASFLVGLVLSSRLQKLVSGPILHLVERAKMVAERNDFSIRAERIAGGELGLLIDGFNQMLAQVQRGNAALTVARDRAEEASRTKSSFLANMSHELRTPLNAIIGYSEMLQEHVQDDERPEYLPDLEKIREAGKLLLGLINDILDLSKIEAGKMGLFIETFPVRPLFDELSSIVQPLMVKNGNRLEVRCADDVSTMQADLTKVRQVVLNLLSNGAKFTEGGTVLLDARRELAGDTSWIVIRVEDSGIGITEAQLGQLFLPFTQADSSTTRKYGGTGLGLAISRRFCQLMGGDITAESEVGKGTKMTARIPAVVAPPEEVPEREQQRTRPTLGVVPAYHSSSAERETTVLVIDDDPTIQDLMVGFLQREGLRAVIAGSGAEGLRLAREIRPAIITLDVMMPEMDGWTVLSQLKADPELSEIPVIMLTVVDEKNMGFALGAADYVTKPIERSRLSAILNRHRRQGRGSRVLVVEDEVDTREKLSETLRKDGWIVSEAANGRVALDRLRESSIDLILLDLAMPVMNGFELVEEIQKHLEWKDVPIIALAPSPLSSTDEARLEGSVKRILQKSSFGPEEIALEVRAHGAARR